MDAHKIMKNKMKMLMTSHDKPKMTKMSLLKIYSILCAYV